MCSCTRSAIKVAINEGDEEYHQWPSASSCSSELNAGCSLKNIKIMPTKKLRKVCKLDGCTFVHCKGKRAYKGFLALHLSSDVNMDLLSKDGIPERMKGLNEV